MARKKQQTQAHSEEDKAKKPAKKPGRSRAEAPPVHQLLHRLVDHAPGAAAPQNIQALQRAVGNRAVGRLLSPASGGETPAVQREATTMASDDQEQLISSPSTTKTPAAPGPVPIPYPNTTPMSQSPTSGSKLAIKNKKTAASKSNLSTTQGDQFGALKGLTSPTNASAVKPSQSKVVLQVPGSPEQEATQPAPAAAPPAEEVEEG